MDAHTHRGEGNNHDSIGDTPRLLLLGSFQKSKWSGVCIASPRLYKCRFRPLFAQDARGLGEKINSMAFDYSIGAGGSTTDVVQQQHRQGEGGKKYYVHLKNFRGSSHLCVSARADNGTKGGPSASQHLSAQTFFFPSQLLLKAKRWKRAIAKKKKLHIIQSLFLIGFFVGSIASSFTFARCVFFLRGRVEQKKTDDTGWSKSWWDVLTRFFLRIFLFLFGFLSFTLLSLNRFSKM